MRFQLPVISGGMTQRIDSPHYIGARNLCPAVSLHFSSNSLKSEESEVKETQLLDEENVAPPRGSPVLLEKNTPR